MLKTRETDLLDSTVAAVAERETSLAPLMTYVLAGAILSPSRVMELFGGIETDEPELTVMI